MRDEDLAAEAEIVAVRMRAAGIWVSFDLLVDVKTAAYMLGKSEGTMKNWRYMGVGPEPIFIRDRSCYRIIDLLRERKSDRAA